MKLSHGHSEHLASFGLVGTNLESLFFSKTGFLEKQIFAPIRIETKFSRKNQAAQHHKDEVEDKDSGSDSDSDSKESGSDSESDSDEEETSAAQRFVQVSRNYWNKQARG